MPCFLVTSVFVSHRLGEEVWFFRDDVGSWLSRKFHPSITNNAINNNNVVDERDARRKLMWKGRLVSSRDLHPLETREISFNGRWPPVKMKAPGRSFDLSRTWPACIENYVTVERLQLAEGVYTISLSRSIVCVCVHGSVTHSPSLLSAPFARSLSFLAATGLSRFPMDAHGRKKATLALEKVFCPRRLPFGQRLIDTARSMLDLRVQPAAKTSPRSSARFSPVSRLNRLRAWKIREAVVNSKRTNCCWRFGHYGCGPNQLR